MSLIGDLSMLKYKNDKGELTYTPPTNPEYDPSHASKYRPMTFRTPDDRSPIRRVFHGDPNSGNPNFLFIPSPTSYKWDMEDVSQSDAGRLEDVKMNKLTVGQVAKISLVWKYVSVRDASILLRIFQPEYVWVEYLDALYGKYRIIEMYTGDRSSPMYNNSLNYNSGEGLWESVSFNLIDREGKIKV